MLLLKRTALVALSQRFVMARIRLVLMYFFMVAHKACPVEGLLEVYGDMVQVLLVLEIFLTEDSQIEDPLCDAHSCSGACLYFSDDLLRL